MNSPSDHNEYLWTTLAECQYLCRITNLCLYFNWRQHNHRQQLAPAGLGSCWLKCGVGKKFTDSTNKFGLKNTANNTHIETQVVNTSREAKEVNTSTEAQVVKTSTEAQEVNTSTEAHGSKTSNLSECKGHLSTFRSSGLLILLAVILPVIILPFIRLTSLWRCCRDKSEDKEEEEEIDYYKDYY